MVLFPLLCFLIFILTMFSSCGVTANFEELTLLFENTTKYVRFTKRKKLGTHT